MSEEQLPKKVVAQLSQTMKDSWKDVQREERAARLMLREAEQRKEGLWEDLYERHDLVPTKKYRIDTDTGKVEEVTSFEPDNGNGG